MEEEDEQITLFKPSCRTKLSRERERALHLGHSLELILSIQTNSTGRPRILNM